MPRILVIAEAGVNHNGSVAMARDLVTAAAEAGADIVKFQSFKTSRLVTCHARKAGYQAARTRGSRTQREMLERLELPSDAWHNLIDLCARKRIAFLSTPFDEESLRELVEDYRLPMLKIASGEITNPLLLLPAARSGCRLILSTGMATLAEVETALGIIAYGRATGGRATRGHPTSADAPPSLEAFREAYRLAQAARPGPWPSWFSAAGFPATDPEADPPHSGLAADSGDMIPNALSVASRSRSPGNAPHPTGMPSSSHRPGCRPPSRRRAGSPPLPDLRARVAGPPARGASPLPALTGLDGISLLHCTTEYPAPFAEVNLRAMDTLRAAFGLEVGLSDHTEGIAISLAAVARGATIIEKHFTLDRTLPGPDHQASLDPAGLRALVMGIRAVEAALGSSAKIPSEAEIHNMAVARKSLVALRPIAKGAPYTPANLGAKRPGTGVSPLRYYEFLGRRAPRDLAADELVPDLP
ncbi:MAG: N-acetylneuraminate synthase [Candidatus Riflebacteria bacterium]|nr:N-acetylneuraminate synthase [Candidatus Riflebacteria bacterium]